MPPSEDIPRRRKSPFPQQMQSDLRKPENGRCTSASRTGMRSGRTFHSSIHFIAAGARYITLCHTKNNDICDSSTDTIENDGLSKFGKQVVKEMNRLGLMVDVSHISDQSFFDVLAVSEAPVIASHSCARALCNNPRNLDDKMLQALAEHGGVIQMCILSDYVKTPDPNPKRDSARAALRIKYNGFEGLSEEEMKNARKEWYGLEDIYPQKLANVCDVVDHIDHIVKVAGIDHVGIGTDFDGGGGVKGCYDVSGMKNITVELLRRGYSESGDPEDLGREPASGDEGGGKNRAETPWIIRFRKHCNRAIPRRSQNSRKRTCTAIPCWGAGCTRPKPSTENPFSPLFMHGNGIHDVNRWISEIYAPGLQEQRQFQEDPCSILHAGPVRRRHDP